jgi:hypothetical protein
MMNNMGIGDCMSKENYFFVFCYAASAKGKA